MRQTTNQRTLCPGVALVLVALVAALMLGGLLQAREVGAAEVSAADDSETELAKKTQNPVSDLISVPFQNNFDFGVGPKEKTVWTLNVQPVVPITLTEDWNLISRIIMPIINKPALFPGDESEFGLGDINPTFFLSPAKPGQLIWGVGPVFTFPTATSAELGAGKWLAGPSAVALTIRGPWVVGALINQQWSFAGWGARDVSRMLLQPFANYNLKQGWYFTSAPILLADWKGQSGDKWIVPLGGGAGKLFKLGKLPINTSLQAYGNVVKPQEGADWQLRFQIQFLFPK